MTHRTTLLFAASVLLAAGQAQAQDPGWRKDIEPIVKAKCGACHGASAPIYEEWNLDRKNFEARNTGPRMDSYVDFMRHVVWPATGSVMRRLDDGKNAGGKPGNMYAYLSANDDERARNLGTLKAWLGEGAWNLNRWETRGSVPGITKEQHDRARQSTDDRCGGRRPAPPHGTAERGRRVIYRFIRHPMYLSLMLLGIGVCLKNPTWIVIGLGAVNCAALVATALKEEQEVVGEVGKAYETYMTRSKRFLPYLL